MQLPSLACPMVIMLDTQGTDTEWIQELWGWEEDTEDNSPIRMDILRAECSKAVLRIPAVVLVLVALTVACILVERLYFSCTLALKVDLNQPPPSESRCW